MTDRPRIASVLPVQDLKEKSENIKEFFNEMHARLLAGESRALVVEIADGEFLALPINMSPEMLANVCTTLLHVIQETREVEQAKAENPQVIN